MVRAVNIFFVMLLLPVLSGCVEAFMGAVATTGMVVAQERTVGEAVDDTAIWTEINHHLFKQDVTLFSKVDVKVNQGKVLLTGIVKDIDTRVLAVQSAWKPKGVKEVLNEIQIAEKIDPKRLAKDAFITSQIKGKLLLERDVRSINYSIETVNGIVYLMGIAQDEVELQRVADISSRIKNVKTVISHVKVKEE